MSSLFSEGTDFVIFDFDDSLEREVPLELIKTIQRVRNQKNPVITLWINSFGGYRHLVFQLISLVEIAKREGIIVRTVITDNAYSAGSILAVSGTEGERYMERTSEHLIHYGLTGSSETTPEQVERNYIQKKEGFDKIKRHYLKYTKIDPTELDRLMSDDNAFIPAAKAIKMGLADKFIDNGKGKNNLEVGTE